MNEPALLVSLPVMQAIVNYLQERPWKEVSNLINAVVALQVHECSTPEAPTDGPDVPR